MNHSPKKRLLKIFIFLFIAFGIYSSAFAQNANPLKEPVYGSIEEALAAKNATQLNYRDRHLFHISDSIKELKNLRFINLMGNNLETS